VREAASRPRYDSPCHAADLETVERLERASFPDHWTSETLRNALRDPAYLVLLSDEAGFLLGWHIGEEAG
jgi:hypothetical protein